MMNAELTAENRPAYICQKSASCAQDGSKATHEDERCVQIFVVLLCVIPVKVFGFLAIDGEEIGSVIIGPQRFDELFEGRMEAASRGQRQRDDRGRRIVHTTSDRAGLLWVLAFAVPLDLPVAEVVFVPSCTMGEPKSERISSAGAARYQPTRAPSALRVGILTRAGDFSDLSILHWSEYPRPSSAFARTRNHRNKGTSLYFSDDNEGLYLGDITVLAVLTATRTLGTLVAWKAHVNTARRKIMGRRWPICYFVSDKTDAEFID